MKFVFFVEGETEKRCIPGFLKRWLDVRLSDRVGITPVCFDGWHAYKKDLAKKVELNLSGPSGSDVIAAIGLLDLYGPDFYPAGMPEASDRRNWARKFFESMVGHEHFRQHFAVYELEAWILAEPRGLPNAVQHALPGNCANPEVVNFTEPPGKLLERLYREKLKRHYKKTTDGTNLFRDLDPETVYAKGSRVNK